MPNTNKGSLLLSLGLLVLAVLFFCATRDLSRLPLRNVFLIEQIAAFGKNIRHACPKLLGNLFIKNYLVDVLWFCSFSFFINYFLPQKNALQFFLSFALGALSEMLQLLFPQLGTFDILDLLAYAFIALVFYACTTYGRTPKE